MDIKALVRLIKATDTVTFTTKGFGKVTLESEELLPLVEAYEVLQQTPRLGDKKKFK